MEFVSDPEVLAAVYDTAAAAHGRGPRHALDPEDMALLRAATLLVVSTGAADGLSVSPRGGRAGEIALVRDARTVWLADEAVGRVHETVTNLLADPRIGLVAMAPGRHDTLRVRGTARVTVDPATIDAFGDLNPRSVIVVDVSDVRRAGRGPLLRAGLWQDDRQPPPTAGPGPGRTQHG